MKQRYYVLAGCLVMLFMSSGLQAQQDESILDEEEALSRYLEDLTGGSSDTSLKSDIEELSTTTGITPTENISPSFQQRPSNKNIEKIRLSNEVKYRGPKDMSELIKRAPEIEKAVKKAIKENKFEPANFDFRGLSKESSKKTRSVSSPQAPLFTTTPKKALKRSGVKKSQWVISGRRAPAPGIDNLKRKAEDTTKLFLNSGISNKSAMSDFKRLEALTPQINSQLLAKGKDPKQLTKARALLTESQQLQRNLIGAITKEKGVNWIKNAGRKLYPQAPITQTKEYKQIKADHNTERAALLTQMKKLAKSKDPKDRKKGMALFSKVGGLAKKFDKKVLALKSKKEAEEKKNDSFSYLLDQTSNKMIESKLSSHGDNYSLKSASKGTLSSSTQGAISRPLTTQERIDKNRAEQSSFQSHKLRDQQIQSLGLRTVQQNERVQAQRSFESRMSRREALIDRLGRSEVERMERDGEIGE